MTAPGPSRPSPVHELSPLCPGQQAFDDVVSRLASGNEAAILEQRARHAAVSQTITPTLDMSGHHRYALNFN